MMELLKKTFQATIGLLIFAFGVYLTVQADIGLAPWDTFSMGLSYHLPITFGQASIMISILFVVIDLCLREKIGLGMILDSLLVGAAFDGYDSWQLIPVANSLIAGLIYMTVGLFIMAFAQWLYMGAALGCGPRDTFMVAIGKRLRKVPIGAVSIGIMVTVLITGWLLGGPVGIGTAYSVFGTGIIMQLVFHIVKFEPRDVVHENLLESVRKLYKVPAKEASDVL